jgi:hypothetical protein
MLGLIKKLAGKSSLFNLKCSLKPLSFCLLEKQPNFIGVFKRFSEDLLMAYANGVDKGRITENLTPQIQKLPTQAQEIILSAIDYGEAWHQKSGNAGQLELKLYKHIFDYTGFDLTFDQRMRN